MKMKKGKGKRKKQIVIVPDDPASDEDEKSVRRMGRPQKPFKDEFEEVDGIEKIEKELNAIEDDSKRLILNKNTKNHTAADNGEKRKIPSQAEEKSCTGEAANKKLRTQLNNSGKKMDSVEIESSTIAKVDATGLIKSTGYRPNGSRRKNKPRRAAEVGVECR